MDAEDRSMDNVESRRERRFFRRRGRILSAAARIFAEKGYGNATTKEIAREADMGESTLYNYFESKREILLTITGQLKDEMPLALQRAQALGGTEAIIAMFESAMDITDSMLPFVRTLIGEAWLDEAILQDYVVAYITQVHRVIKVFIQERIDAGDIRKVDPDLVAQLVMGMYASLFLPALRGVKPLPPREKRRELIESIVDIIFNGVRRRPEEQVA